MKRPNKKERNEAYVNALKLIKSRDNDFICNAIEWLFSHNLTCSEKTFPELFLFRNKYCNAWISAQGKGEEFHSGTVGGIKIREIILLLCIEMTS
jgi:hypothetical protein